MVRLLICDDSAELRAALRTMLAHHPEIEIVAEAADGGEAIALMADHAPDVVLMDVLMPVLDGVEATRRIRQMRPETKVVAFAGSEDSDVVMTMIEAGAAAYCVKGAPLWELERAIVDQPDPLVRLARTLSRTVEGRAIGDLVARELADSTPATSAAVYLAAPDGGLVSGGSAGDLAPEHLARPPALVRRAFERLELARADADDLAELAGADFAPSEALAAPLVADGTALGAILLCAGPAASRPLDTRFAAAAADIAAGALVTERRLAASFTEARRDPLTGLGNKRAFDEHLDRLIESVGETGDELSIVLFDLDDFKRVNDEHGHLVGDEVLRELSKLLLRSLRSSEEAFRVGGEELAVVVQGGADAAARVAERVRSAIHGRRRGRRLPTVSAGVAAHRPAERKEQLIERADVALYAAKRSGKDRVVVHRQDTLPETNGEATRAPQAAEVAAESSRQRLRILLVDDDEGLRLLLRTTLEAVDVDVEEAETADAAARMIAARRPDLVVLDVWMPGTNGLELCRRLKEDPATRDIRVVLLTGADEATSAAAELAGADAFLRKPFSPLEVLSTVERLAFGVPAGPFRIATERASREQLLLYAEDLRRLREVERGQRALLQRAYRETVAALAAALESKDVGTGAHSQRVQRYAVELAFAVEPRLLEDPSVEYGFLLHDVGKIGIPDNVLRKEGPLTPSERRLMETHTVLGEQMLGEVALLQGEGLRVVRSHHERWNGRGYPDRMAGDEIPLGARIFAVADALDAMTSHRPYREAAAWDRAVKEILRQSGRQFDPDVVEGFRNREPELRRVHAELTAA